MDSEINARRLIESIRDEYELDSSNPTHVAQLRTLIEMISSQLYDNAVHFLLELLQNADDNVYYDSEPRVKFTYTPGYLRFDCNEAGFDAANVRAICAVGASTKSGQNKASDVIGEKGIGFKSVFKVADVVWVASGPYRFKFDTSQKLGMVAPTWADFPVEPPPTHTSFYLQLSKDFNQDELFQDLKTFDPERLLFLRRIKVIELSIQQPDGQSWAAKLLRTVSTDQEKPITRIEQGPVQLSYYVVKHKVEALPVEDKRPGFSTTELQLAFPMLNSSREATPGRKSRKVYAYLPIGEYGLQFILQGDFLLSASRLQIDTSSQWNQTLRAALGDAFLNVVREFNKGDERYLWPGYLPDERTAPFFIPAQQRIRQTLMSKPVVESFDQSMHCPSELARVPLKFIGRDGLPFSLNQQTAGRYLSQRYSEWAIDALHTIGVSTLSDEQFLSDLGEMVITAPALFRSRQDDWHAGLATTLVPLTVTKKYRSILRNMSLVPLTDGSWVAAKTGPVFFIGDLQHEDFPLGDAISIVHPQVAANGNRHNLLSSLGIKPIERSQLCSCICEAHCAPSFHSEEWTTTQLVAQVNFLFQSAHRLPQDTDLWFATIDNKRRKGSQLYFQGHYGKDSPAARIFCQLKEKFPTLHPSYTASGCYDKPWHSFLTDSLHLSDIPRLVCKPNPGSQSYRLSDEFRYIFQTCRHSDVLGLLNEYWHTYSAWLEPDSGESSGATAALLKDISDVIVQTTAGPTRLRDSVLPELDRRLQRDRIPSLEIEKTINDLQKQRLSRFGIAVSANARYYLSCLKSMSDQNRPDLDTLSYIYEQIQDRYDSDEDLVSTAFQTQNFIYVSCKSRKSDQIIGWLSITECQKRNIDLATEYPRSQQLFKFLSVDGTDEIERLISRATNIDHTHDLELIAQIFVEINNALADLTQKRIASLMKKFQNRPVFPIIKGAREESYDELKPLEAVDWEIADRPFLRDSFAGEMPLLAFSPKRIHSLERFLAALKLDSRKLSRLTKGNATPQGRLKLSETHTKFLRSRASFLCELLPESTKDPSKSIREIRDLCIYQVTEIKQVCTARYRNADHEGRPSKGEIALATRNNRMQLYLTREALAFKTLPLETAKYIASHFSMNESFHLSLLQAVISEIDVRRLQNNFEQEGFFVEVDAEAALPSPNEGKLSNQDKDNYQSLSGDVFSIPSPFDFPKEDIDNKESFARFGTKSKRGARSTRGKKEKEASRTDKRIPKVTFTRIDAQDSVLKHSTVSTDEQPPHRDLQYLGECMVSRLLQVALGQIYNPTSRWTSPLKARSGLQCRGRYAGSSSFTFRDRDGSRAMTNFLCANGHPDAARWKHMHPNYHLEIMVSTGHANGLFPWSSEKLEMAKQFHLPERSGPHRSIKDVLVLIQISNVYAEPQFHLIVDPWQLVKSGQFDFKGNHALEASIPARAVRPMHNAAGPRPTGHWRDADPTNGGHRTQAFEPRAWGSHQSTAQKGVSPRWATVDWRTGDARQASVEPSPQLQETPSETQSGTANMPATGMENGQQLSPSQSWDKRFSNPPTSTQTPTDQASKPVIPLDRADAKAAARAPPSQGYHRGPHGEVPAISTLNLPAESSTPQYKYHKLPKEHVRLFMLFPGKHSAPLKGCIYSVPFDDAGIYRTLSYVWGDKEQQMHTLVTPEGSIQITEALKIALEKLRLRKQMAILWIDALCINQADPEEKAQQIFLLPEIFQNAACTLAFVGADGDGDAAIEMLLQIRAKDVVKRNSDAGWPEGIPVVDDSWETRRTPPLDAAIWVDVRALFSRPWFRRVWIVQEMVIAPTVKVICGKWMIEWHDLFAAMEIVEQEHEALSINLRPWTSFLALGMHREWEARGQRWPLSLLLETYRHVASTLTRDRFFALLGLAVDGDRDEFHPNYKAKFESVALRVAEGILAQGQGIKLLYRAGLTAQSDRFPSWLPDWTVSRPGSLADSLDRGLEFDACAGIEGTIIHVQGADEITVLGRVVDEIAETTASANEPQFRKLYFGEIDKMVESLRKRVAKGEFGEWSWKTPVAGAETPSHDSSVDRDTGLRDSYKAFRQLLKKPKPGSAEESSAYVSLLDDKVLGWRFALTKENRCATIPHQGRQGDRVCILRNGAVPFLIRRAGEAGCYNLVGECYVTGIMQGELRDSFGGLRDPIRIR